MARKMTGTFTKELAFALAQRRRLEPFVARRADEAGRFVPGRAAAHHLLGHVHRLACVRSGFPLC